jgi:histidinol dehydrogenase
VGDFLKRSSFTYYSRESLKKEAGHIECLAGFENLLAHKNSVAERFEEENER